MPKGAEICFDARRLFEKPPATMMMSLCLTLSSSPALSPSLAYELHGAMEKRRDFRDNDVIAEPRKALTFLLRLFLFCLPAVMGEAAIK